MPFGTITKKTWKKNFDTESRYKRKMKKLNPREKQQVKQIVNRNLELNYLNFIPTSNTFYTTPFIVDVTSGISMGTTDNQRVGDELEASTMEFRAHIFHQPGGTQLVYFNRLIFFQWKPDNTTQPPTMSDILLAGTTGIPNYTAMYNHDKRSLYKIMYDATIVTTNGDTSVMNSNGGKFVRKFVKIPHKSIQYISGTVAGPGHIFMMIVGSAPNANEVDMNLTAVIKYRG